VPRVQLTFHMTLQTLTGHGCFQPYLHRMGRAVGLHYMHCPCLSDTTEHTVFHCPQWDGLRTDLGTRLGHPLAILQTHAKHPLRSCLRGSSCRPSREGKRPAGRRRNVSAFLSDDGKHNDSERGRREGKTSGRGKVTGALP